MTNLIKGIHFSELVLGKGHVLLSEKPSDEKLKELSNCQGLFLTLAFGLIDGVAALMFNYRLMFTKDQVALTFTRILDPVSSPKHNDMLSDILGTDLTPRCVKCLMKDLADIERDAEGGTRPTLQEFNTIVESAFSDPEFPEGLKTTISPMLDNIRGILSTPEPKEETKEEIAEQIVEELASMGCVPNTVKEYLDEIMDAGDGMGGIDPAKLLAITDSFLDNPTVPEFVKNIVRGTLKDTLAEEGIEEMDGPTEDMPQELKDVIARLDGMPNVEVRAFKVTK